MLVSKTVCFNTLVLSFIYLGDSGASDGCSVIQTKDFPSCQSKVDVRITTTNF